MHEDNSRLLIRLEEAAVLLSVSYGTVRSLIKQGAIPSVKIGRGLRVPLKAVEAFAMGDNVSKTTALGNSPDSHFSAIPQPAAPEHTSVEPEVFALPNPTATAKSDQTKAVGNEESSLPSPITIAFLLEEWLREAAIRVRPKTYRSYEQLTRLHLLPALGHYEIATIDIRILDTFLRDKLESGLSPRTVHYLRALLRQAFGEAHRWGWVDRNIVKFTRPPRVERHQFEVLSREEARRLLASFPLCRYGAIYTTALGLGLRMGEVLGLRWTDVKLPADRDDFADKAGSSNEVDDNFGQITVKFQLQKVGQQFSFVAPKSKTSVRALTLPRFVARALAQRRVVEQDEKRIAGHTWVGGDWDLVFSNQWGGPLDEAKVRKRFREHLEHHHFPALRVHDLRHLCASLLLAQGTHPRIIMDILGHSQISLTMDTYSHVLPSVHHEAAEAMDDILSGIGVKPYKI